MSRQCFTVDQTAYLRNLDADERRETCFAIHYQEPDKDLGNGRKSISMRAPVLIVSFWMAEQEAIAAKVARILNVHWDDPAFADEEVEPQP